MKNMIHPPEDSFVIPAWTNGTGSDVASGEPVVFAGGVAVAMGAIADGEIGSLLCGFVHKFAKTSAQAWTHSQDIYFDASTGVYTTVSAGNTHAGWAHAAAANPSATGEVRLRVPQSLAFAVAGAAVGYKVARGETALDGSNATPVATGLATVIAFVATLKGTAAPGVGTSVLTSNIAGAAGNVDVYAWKPTSNSDPTLIASTGTESFYWVAIGT